MSEVGAKKIIMFFVWFFVTLTADENKEKEASSEWEESHSVREKAKSERVSGTWPDASEKLAKRGQKNRRKCRATTLTLCKRRL